MPSLPPYETLVSQLLLPSTILELVEPPFQDLGYPLQKESIEDLKLNTLEYLCAQSKGQQIVLLHIPGDIIGDPANWTAVVNVAYVFIGKTAGLFFFAPIKDLSRDYNGLLATSLERASIGTKRVKFFDQGDIDNLTAKTPPQRRRLITLLLDVDKLLPPTNGRPPAGAEPNLAEIQERLIQILFDRAQVAGVDSRTFFSSLRSQLEWPPDWKWEPKATSDESARDLVLYLISQKCYPAASGKNGYTTLGFLLGRIIPQVGGDTARDLYQIILKYRLIVLDDVLDDFKRKYCP